MGRASWLGIFANWRKNSNDEKNSGYGGRRKRKTRKWLTLWNRAGKSSPSDNRGEAEIEPTWLRNLSAESEIKHAIAVAAASAAAADAAIAAAKAAVAVVRLTSHGRGTMFSGSHERWAAVTIQTFYRGYLARKALRALKALVKLQALVRGYLVRKKAGLVHRSGRGVVRLHSSARRSRKSLLQSRIQKHFDDCITRRADSPSLRRFALRNDSSSSSHNRSPALVEIETVQRYSGEKCRCCSTTAQCTLRLLSSSVTAPATPAKLGPEAFSRKHGSPNHMSNTESFVGKLRSQSAPRQRAEVVARTAMNGIMDVGIVPVRRSCSQIPEAVRFRGVVVKKLVERSWQL